jgi:folate-binding protein YgfZ
VTSAAHLDLRSTLGGVPRPFDVVRAVGPDAFTYLQGQLSQQLDGLAVGDTTPALLLQPTGKLTAWLRVVRVGDDRFELVVDEGSGAAVLARLQRFKLRTDVELTLTTRPGVAIRGPGAHTVVPPDGLLAVPAGWPGVEGVDLIPDDAADATAIVVPPGVEPVRAEALDAVRIECGVPAMGAELTDQTIPAEGGQWLIDASVSFTKGCYTGQELVARIDSRGGNVPRPVRGLLIDRDPATDSPALLGASIQVNGAEVGTLTSVGTSPTLGVVGLAPLPRSVEPDAAVTIVAHGASWPAVIREVPLR